MLGIVCKNSTQFHASRRHEIEQRGVRLVRFRRSLRRWILAVTVTAHGKGVLLGCQQTKLQRQKRQQ